MMIVFPIWPVQIQADNHGHRDQGFGFPGVPAVTLLMVWDDGDLAAGAWEDRDMTCYTITKDMDLKGLWRRRS